MKAFIRLHAVLLCFLTFLCPLFTSAAAAADTNALTLVKKILLPNVTGQIDHFAQDVKGQRLFLAAQDNNTVEVIDLAGDKYAGTIGNCSSPQGLAYIPAGNRLVIANSGNGTVKILDATSFKILTTLADLPDCRNVRYDSKTDMIYLGGGNTLTLIRAAGGELVSTIKLPGHAASFQCEQTGNRVFVNEPDIQKVAVIDSAMPGVVESWWVTDAVDNYPMALDEAGHRLFIGCRRPARMLVLDTATGDKVTQMDISKDVENLYYDAARKQVYASCGGGLIDIISQTTPDSYDLRQRITTAKEARTCWFSPERGELYVAVPASLISGGAEIRVFKCRQ